MLANAHEIKAEHWVPRGVAPKKHRKAAVILPLIFDEFGSYSTVSSNFYTNTTGTAFTMPSSVTCPKAGLFQVRETHTHTGIPTPSLNSTLGLLFDVEGSAKVNGFKLTPTGLIGSVSYTNLGTAPVGTLLSINAMLPCQTTV